MLVGFCFDKLLNFFFLYLPVYLILRGLVYPVTSLLLNIRRIVVFQFVQFYLLQQSGNFQAVYMLDHKLEVQYAVLIFNFFFCVLIWIVSIAIYSCLLIFYSPMSNLF